KLIEIARSYFGEDKRVKLICDDAANYIQNYKGDLFDLVFADAWPGKYSDIDKILQLVKVGGFYVIDDMTAQPNWPKGHENNVEKLVDYLEKREDFNLTKMNWSTGLIIAVRKS
ncbi:MAG: SAM-dependent methyltransferase, partial [Leeuwenhoekiella sp.]